MKKGYKEEVDAQVAKLFYTSVIPFNVIRNSAFAKLCEMIGKYGVGYKPPSYHDIREKLLKQAVNKTDAILEDYKEEWKTTGCTIMSDGWTDKKGRSICNFLVNSPKEMVFLYSLDTSNISKTTDKVFKMLDNVVEFVGEENVVQVVTNNAANFRAERVVDAKEGKIASLLTMFSSKEWKTNKFGTSQEGRKVEHVVLDSQFWKNVSTCLKVVAPLMVVLRLVDSDVKLAMGFIYEEMDCAKEKIMSNFNNIKKSYEEVWRIIDARWNNQLHRPLHAAAYFLNPISTMNLTLNVMMVERGLFGMEDAKECKKELNPGEWWDIFGDGTPKLKRFAIRILSLTCSSSGCERNWSSFEMVHTKRRNRLHQQKMNDLVYVMYNYKLKSRQIRKIVALPFDDIESDDEWITEEANDVVEIKQVEEAAAAEWFTVQLMMVEVCFATADAKLMVEGEDDVTMTWWWQWGYGGNANWEEDDDEGA
ncbi:uncharacterized protein LOC108332656 [Vigna angularis]|uniref:uncharacterized protein LOC108332656 n=1 Tax=Phaseolus angularis TaxID=3914 RepID=UPI0022B577A5|nr:uncharacterized protein LOC108332656 [Vigna angularis]